MLFAVIFWLFECCSTSSTRIKVIAVATWFQIIGRLALDILMVYVVFNGLKSTSSVVAGYEWTLVQDVTLFKGLGLTSIAIHAIWAIPTVFLSRSNQINQSSPVRLYSWIAMTFVVCVFDVAATVLSALKTKEAFDQTDGFPVAWLFGQAVPPLIFSRGFMFFFNFSSMIVMYKRVQEINKSLPGNRNENRRIAPSNPFDNGVQKPANGNDPQANTAPNQGGGSKPKRPNNLHLDIPKAQEMNPFPGHGNGHPHQVPYPQQHSYVSQIQEKQVRNDNEQRMIPRPTVHQENPPPYNHLQQSDYDYRGSFNSPDPRQPEPQYLSVPPQSSLRHVDTPVPPNEPQKPEVLYGHHQPQMEQSPKKPQDFSSPISPKQIQAETHQQKRPPSIVHQSDAVHQRTEKPQVPAKPTSVYSNHAFEQPEELPSADYDDQEEPYWRASNQPPPTPPRSSKLVDDHPTPPRSSKLVDDHPKGEVSVSRQNSGAKKPFKPPAGAFTYLTPQLPTLADEEESNRQSSYNEPDSDYYNGDTVQSSQPYNV